MPKAFSIKRTRLSSKVSRKWASVRARTIKTLTDDVFDKESALSASELKLQNIRNRLQHQLDEIKFLESTLSDRTKRYERAKNELKEMATDMKTLCKPGDPSQAAALELHTTLALDDVAVAENHIRKVFNELDSTSPLVKESTSNDIGNFLRCYDKVILSEPTDNSAPSSLMYHKKIFDCCLCMGYEATCIFANCGHVAICVHCFRKQRRSLNGKCPICRVEYDEIFSAASI